MGKIAKSAKKFVKKHLKSTIEKRRKLKPMKQAFKKKNSSFSGKSGRKKVDENGFGQEAAKKEIKDMSVDEFLDGEFLDDSHEESDSLSQDEGDSDQEENLTTEDGEEDFLDVTPAELQNETSEDDEEEEDSPLQSQNKSLVSEVDKHKKQLQLLKQKDPEFFKFLEEHDKELLDFEDEEMEEESSGKADISFEKGQEAPASCLTTSLIESWCTLVKEKNHVGALCNLLKAYRTACHYGDGEEDEFANKYNISSSHVFNKVMFFTLSEVDGIFRKMLGIDTKETSHFDAEKCARWKKFEPLVKSYLGNTLHILTQMTDNQMISFTLKRLKASTSFMGALPRFARKYLKVALHFWGRGEGSVSLVAFMFIREMCLLMGTDHLDACLKGIYKEFSANSKFVSAAAIPRIRFMINCVVELYGIDLAASYQQAFVFIRQLAIVLRNALTMKTKESYTNVYNWQYINCLKLWVHVLCTYVGKKDLLPLVYPVTQIITGVAQLVPTTRYFPLRMHCVKLLNKIANETGTFIPVTGLLLEMLEFKELNKAPTGGVGHSIDFNSVLKVSKASLKTRAFQDECVAASIEEFAEHLGQWSYAIAFPELALIALIGLRRFAKETKVDRFRRQVKQLVDHIEQNIDYVSRKRSSVNFSPKDAQLVATFLQEEKVAGMSPLSKFVSSLRQSAKQRRANIHTSSVVLKEEQLEDPYLAVEEEDEKTPNVFSSDWLPPKKDKTSSQEDKDQVAKNSKMGDVEGNENSDAEDIVEELEMSSDEEDKEMVSSSDVDNEDQGVQVKLKDKGNKRGSSKLSLTKKPKRSNGGIRPRNSLSSSPGETGIHKPKKKGNKFSNKKSRTSQK